MYEVMHIGVPVKQAKENESYAEGLKVFITDPGDSPFGFEFLRFESDTPMHKDIVENVHFACKVDNLEETLATMEVLESPMVIDENLRIAFGKIDGVVIELMEFKA